MIRTKLSILLISLVEKLYRYAPVKLTSWLLLKLSYFSLKRSPLFDEKYYLASNPDVAKSGIDPIIHFLKEGAEQGRNPVPWFDTSFYMSTHPAVVSVGINPLFHYMILGAHQGYNPHPLFDTSYYVKENPTVAEAGINPLSHFIRNGLKKGLIPHPLLKGVSPENYPAESRNRLLTKRMLELYDVTPDKRQWMARTSNGFRFRPQITIVIFDVSNHERLGKSLKSILDQAYPHWNVVLASGKDYGYDPYPESTWLKDLCAEMKVTFLGEHRLLESTEWVSGEFLALLRSGDALTPDALFECVVELNINPELHLIYFDEYQVHANGQGAFFFKLGWSPELLWGTNYVGDCFLLKKTLFDKIGGLNTLPGQAGIYEVLLRIAQCPAHVVRLPKPLYHRHIFGYNNGEFEPQVLQKSLENSGQTGEVISLEIPANYRVKRNVPRSPLVSIIIPTAFSKPVENMEPCLRSIHEKTTYSNYEILLIDNSRGKIPKEWVNEFVKLMPRLHAIAHNKPFNYSQIINRGVAEARGDYLLLLNDDIEIVSPDWIESMLELAQLDEVGVVGAKLLYPGGRVQHAGGFVVDGPAQTRHAFQYLRDDPESYNGLGSVVRNCSFVTFAAAMIRKEVFVKLGGLDERFDVEYNDSDFCLRAGVAGLRVVYTPHAELIHKDASTRSSLKMVKMARNIELFHDRWRGLIERGDPYYNPNLTLESPDYGISDRPVIVEPLWKGTDTLDFGAHEDQGKHPAAQIATRSKLPLVILIHSTSCDEMRLWPQEHFDRLSGLLSTQLGASVVINTHFKDSSSVSLDCDLVIGGLNENISYAASSGIPTLVIWPGHVGLHEYRHFSKRAMATRMAVPCSPCHKQYPGQCPYDMKCLNMLWPYKVFEAARRVLSVFGRRLGQAEPADFGNNMELPDKGIH